MENRYRRIQEEIYNKGLRITGDGELTVDGIKVSFDARERTRGMRSEAWYICGMYSCCEEKR